MPGFSSALCEFRFLPWTPNCQGEASVTGRRVSGSGNSAMQQRIGRRLAVPAYDRLLELKPNSSFQPEPVRLLLAPDQPKESQRRELLGLAGLSHLSWYSHWYL